MQTAVAERVNRWLHHCLPMRCAILDGNGFDHIVPHAMFPLNPVGLSQMTLTSVQADPRLLSILTA
jgi:hypothetical protein